MMFLKCLHIKKSLNGIAVVDNEMEVHIWYCNK